MNSRYSKTLFLIIFIIFCTSSAIFADQNVRPRVGQRYVDPVTLDQFGTNDSLKKYVSQLLGRKYVNAASIYNAPSRYTRRPKSYISIRREKESVVIAENVALFTGDERGLAVARHDGVLTVWGKYPCSRLHLPDEGTPAAIAYGQDGETLIAASSAGDKVYVYELPDCSRVPGYIPVEHSPVRFLSSTSTGDWISLSIALIFFIVDL